MTIQAIFSDKLAPPPGPFSSAVRANGLIYFSGQVGQDPKTGKVVEGGVEPQTEQIFTNLGFLLEAAGKNFSDVVRAGVYLTDIASVSAMNAIYARFFKSPYPARTTIGVASLPLGAQVEIEFIVLA